MRAKKIALEVNTSGIDIRSQPYPAGNILARARELGISLIAGSDAHRPSQVARHFSNLTEYLS
jgi:histidinol-phosphatase (PHP family)